MPDRIIIMASGRGRVLVEENGEPGKVVLYLTHKAQSDECDFEQKVHILEACGWKVIARAEREGPGQEGEGKDGPRG